jgi:hypothetical protein
MRSVSVWITPGYVAAISTMLHILSTPSFAESNFAPSGGRIRDGRKSSSCGSARCAVWPSGFFGGRCGKDFISCLTIWRMLPRRISRQASIAAILTIDGLGEAACSTLATAVGTRIQMLETFNYPHSLGFVWELISVHLGFSPYDASKVMGLTGRVAANLKPFVGAFGHDAWGKWPEVLTMLDPLIKDAAHQYVLQRQRADCLHARRRDRHIPQGCH